MRITKLQANQYIHSYELNAGKYWPSIIFMLTNNDKSASLYFSGFYITFVSFYLYWLMTLWISPNEWIVMVIQLLLEFGKTGEIWTSWILHIYLSLHSKSFISTIVISHIFLIY